ncbi:MAG: hypothetical protein AAF902_21390 [Chloroflexota bacterium]
MSFPSIKNSALIIFIFSFLLLGAFALAQADERITSPVAPTPTPGYVWSADDQEEEKSSDFQQPRSLNAIFEVGADSCTGAGELLLSYDGFIVESVGDETSNIGDYTTGISPADPNITCLAGTSRPQGYRSVWYKVTAPVGGTMTIKTVTDQDYKRNYDTVIAVFSDSSAGACTGLTQLACNDDFDAFLSEVSFRAEQGETYYIEVVDRNIAASGPVHVNIEVGMEPDSGWVSVTGEGGAATAMPHRLSRHAVVMNGPDAYIIAGQNVLEPNIKRLGQMWRYETDTGAWVQLADMPANEAADGRGYSATDAILVGDKIHMISGYVGSADSYAGEHWVYDIPSNTWSVQTSPQLDWFGDGLQGPVGYGELSSFQDGNQQGFYLTGGLAGQPLASDSTLVRPSAEVRRYSEVGTTKGWVTEPDMQVSRYGHTAVTIGGTVCVAGGLTNDGSNKIVDLVECYDRFGAASWFTIEPMNTSRYYAGSVVGPNGVWYVFGGRDASQNYVSTMEAIDITQPGATWQTLDLSFSLDNPPFAWLRGDFVNERLYLFGGDIPNNFPTGVVQSHDFSQLELPQTTTAITPTNAIYIPSVSYEPAAAVSAPLGAQEVFIGSHVFDNYDGPGDAYNIYQFNPATTVSVMFDLVIPDDADYDLLLYDADKNLVQVGNNIGSRGEWLMGTFPAGRYYLIVARVAPPPSLPPSEAGYELFVSPHP